MSKGEFDSPSKAATDAYRENWERIFVKHLKLDPAFEGAMYPNGCPILNEDLGIDQPHGPAA